MSWTHEEIEIVRVRWGAGDSAGEISKLLKNRSRNAVIGKVHRSGYTRNGEADMEAVAERRLKSQNRERHAKRIISTLSNYEPAVITEPLFPDFVELHDCPLGSVEGMRSLTQDQCKFPIGDPRNSDFHFCGGTQKAGSSYCEHHHSIAYEPRARTREANKQAYYHAKNGLNYRNVATA